MSVPARFPKLCFWKRGRRGDWRRRRMPTKRHRLNQKRVKSAHTGDELMIPMSLQETQYLKQAEAAQLEQLAAMQQQAYLEGVAAYERELAAAQEAEIGAAQQAQIEAALHTELAQAGITPQE